MHGTGRPGRSSYRLAAAALLGALALVAAGCGSTLQSAGGPAGSGPGGGDPFAPSSDATSDDTGASADGSGAVGGGGSGSSRAGTGGSAVGGGTSTGTGRGGSGGATRGGTGGGGSSPAAAKTGRGFTEKEIRIGVHSSENTAQFAATFGLPMELGDTFTQVTAIIDDMNARGGILGRKVKAVWYDDDATNENGDQLAQEACDRWTRDEPVFAVASAVAAGQNALLFDCLKKRDTPLMTSIVGPFDQQLFDTWSTHLLAPGFLNSTRMMKTFVDRLAAQDFFRPRTAGKPVKIGMVRTDDGFYERTARALDRELRAHGYKLDEDFSYKASSASALAAGIGNAILRFRTEDVTHVFILDSTVLTFMQGADQQTLRPRYALTSYQSATFMQQLAPREQLLDSVGIGWLPWNDVDELREPDPVSEAESRCEAVITKAGQSWTGFARGVSSIYCDTLWLIEDGVKAGGLSTPGMRAAIEAMGSSHRSAITWSSTFGPRRHDSTSAVRDLYYNADCGCFDYRGGLHPL